LKLLILTQYFPPETGAPQNRLFWLAKAMVKNGFDVSVLTAMPNYPQMKVYKGYRNKFYLYEEMDGIKVHRCYIYASTKKSIPLRLANYFSFVKTSFLTGICKIRKTDYILCESPPLFLGITALLLKIIKRSRLIFNVSDLWPESAEKLGIISNRLLLNVSKTLEEIIYKNSEFITGQTQGIVSNIHSRFPDKRIFWLKNGIQAADYLNLAEGWRAEAGYKPDDFILIYAGIIGHAQGLEVILKAAAILKGYDKIKFIIAGSGPEKPALLRMAEKMELKSVVFPDSMPKNKMLSVINESDAGIIPLKNLELFRGAIPSKIFDNLALKKPVLLGIEGEAKSLFIDRGNCGLAFKPENENDLADKILTLYNSPELVTRLGENAFNYGMSHFLTDRIADDFIKFIC
jgi:glycosyltransferase involved in cell wall biosynthesis